MKKIVIKLPSVINTEVYSFDKDYLRIEKEHFDNNQLPINTRYHQEKYGFSLAKSEIDVFNLHHIAWETIAQCEDDFALIVEENVDISSINIKFDDILQVPSNWDVFFPYNKQDELLRNIEFKEQKTLNSNIRELIDIEPYRTGIEWGSSYYFISKKGAKILLTKINEISQRVEDEILELAQTNQLNLYIADCEWFDLGFVHPKKHIDRLNNIRTAVLSYEKWTPSQKELIDIILAHVSKVGSDTQTRLLLQGGTHLGYIRHGSIMGWDDDVDIGIEESRFKEFAEKVEVGPFRITQCIEKSTDTIFYKIWHCSGEPVGEYPYKFPLIDLWLYSKKGKDIIFKNGIVCPNTALHPPIEVLFEGHKYFIPWNSLEVLDSRYKDWRSMIRIYSFSHAEECQSNHILTTEIMVDENGRILLNN